MRDKSHRPTTAVWREEAKVEIAQARLALDYLTDERRNGDRVDQTTLEEIREALDRASDAAGDRGLWWPGRVLSALRGASIESAYGHIDAANEALLRVAPAEYAIGQLPRLTHRVQRMLPATDPRRSELEVVAGRCAESGQSTLSPTEREILVVALHGADCESRRRHSRIRSFRNMLLLCGLVLTLAAAGLALLGYARPNLALMCFQPTGQAVCPTRVVNTGGEAGQVATGQPDANATPASIAAQDAATRRAAGPGDVILVELMGLIAATVAAAAALRHVRGTSTPYGVPFAVAVLKLPTGALTAALGLLLMRADFVPGLSALDSPAQIIGWAIVFGYAQELFTRLVDARAQTVLTSAGASESAAPAAAASGEPVRPAPSGATA